MVAVRKTPASVETEPGSVQRADAKGGSASPSEIRAMRRFNRFYTRLVGALDEGHLESPFSLAEVRVLYELAHRERPLAREIGEALGLDAGYLSRILKRFRDAGLIDTEADANDRRQTVLSLSDRGRETFAPLYAASNAEVGRLLGDLSPAHRARLLESMAEIQRLLARQGSEPEVILRPHRPGDMGWVVQREALLYTGEYGWDDSFEAMVAEIVATFLKNFDPAREACFIAELDGVPVGAIFLIASDEAGTAKIRLLHVDAEARGHGIGRRLVAAAISFARERSYARVKLWTNDILTAARRIYQDAGFRLVEEERHHSFGKDLVGQIWELDLG